MFEIFLIIILLILIGIGYLLKVILIFIFDYIIFKLIDLYNYILTKFLI